MKAGIIISQNDSELLVVTNIHVVEGSVTLTVSFNDVTAWKRRSKEQTPQGILQS